MTNLTLKTPAQQRLEWLENLNRPLTDEESDMLRRSLHADYCHRRKSAILHRHREEEIGLLAKVQRECDG